MNTATRTVGRLVVAAAVAALVLTGLGAKGAVAEQSGGGYKSAADFKWFCERFGGVFTDTGDGNLWCQWENGEQTVCDSNGQDCHVFFEPQPVSPWGDIGPTDGVLTPVTEPLAPVADSPTIADPEPSAGDGVVNDPTPAAAKQLALAPDDAPEQDGATSKKGKGKKDKHGKKGDKHRKR